MTKPDFSRSSVLTIGGLLAILNVAFLAGVLWMRVNYHESSLQNLVESSKSLRMDVSDLDKRVAIHETKEKTNAQAHSIGRAGPATVQ